MTWTSDRTLRLEFPGTPAVHAAFAALAAADIPGIADLTPALSTLLVTIDDRAATDPAAAARVERRVREIVSAARATGGTAGPTDGRAPPVREVVIPVRYGGPHGPDLNDVARECGLTAAAVIEAHAGRSWTALFVGFTPGFAYLGLDDARADERSGPPRLEVARLERPRPRVEPGSVGLAGTWTGVYPSATPGGWRIIGRTDERMFDPSREPAALLRAGDRVRFVPL